MVLKVSMYYLKEKTWNPWTWEQSVHCRYLPARREKMIFAGIVNGDVFINFLTHCDTEALSKSIYKSETENHLSCEWTMEWLAPGHSMCIWSWDRSSWNTILITTFKPSLTSHKTKIQTHDLKAFPNLPSIYVQRSLKSPLPTHSLFQSTDVLTAPQCHYAQSPWSGMFFHTLGDHLQWQPLFSLITFHEKCNWLEHNCVLLC